MKKMLALLTALSIMLIACACPAYAGQAQVMTSFYPIYIFALNIFNGIDGVKVSCMAPSSTGCLHDYQLLTGDMIKLSQTDMLIVCGAGMESYLDDVRQQFQNLTIVDCSAGIDLIEENEHDEDHESSDINYNAHTWLDANNAIIIVQNIAQNAAKAFPEYADKINSNMTDYCAKLSSLDAEIKEILLPYSGKNIVTFHEAFPYFARAYGLKIAAVMSDEHESNLSPKELQKVIEAVHEAGNPPLFTEPSVSSTAAQTISQETGSAICELDPITTGDVKLDAYETRMLNNAYLLRNALEQNN